MEACFARDTALLVLKGTRHLPWLRCTRLAVAMRTVHAIVSSTECYQCRSSDRIPLAAQMIENLTKALYKHARQSNVERLQVANRKEEPQKNVQGHWSV